MLEPIPSMRDSARLYHRLLPQKIRQYLNRHGIPDVFIDKYLIGWNGYEIMIPVEDRNGDMVFFTTMKVRAQLVGPPRLHPGSSAELYGWDSLRRQPDRIVICGDELDRLVLEAHGFPAVASTAGPDSFEREWVPHFEAIDHVYVCMDRSEEGDRAAQQVVSLIPRARVVVLPEEVGLHGKVRVFFVRLGRTRDAFDALLRAADRRSESESNPLEDVPATSALLKRAQRLTSAVPLTRVIEKYTRLEEVDGIFIGRCPLHEDCGTSLQVYPDRNTFQCSGCAESGDAIRFLQKLEDLTFGQALEALEEIRFYDD